MRLASLPSVLGIVLEFRQPGYPSFHYSSTLWLPVKSRHTYLIPPPSSITIRPVRIEMKTSRYLLTIAVLGLILLAIPVVSALPSGTSTYSVVHLSDTQNLATYYPGTYDFTFSYLESLKTHLNISAIIITGDLVNTWNKKTEWDAYSHARNQTTIPIFVTAGNHDTNRGKNYQYYSQVTGGDAGNYITSLNDFNFVGINYVDKTLAPGEFTVLRQAIVNSPQNFTIIATHYYMDRNGKFSILGKDIDRELIGKPTLILAGHVHVDFVRVKTIGGYPVIEDLTNYQDGDPDRPAEKNYSAGTLYTVTAADGRVVKLTSNIIRIFPKQSIDTEKVLYDITPEIFGNVTTTVPEVSVQVKVQSVVNLTNNTETASGDDDGVFHAARSGNAFIDMVHSFLNFITGLFSGKLS